MRSSVVIKVPHKENINRVIKVIEGVCERIKEVNDTIVEGPSVLGISSLDESGVGITVIAKTKPMDQWALERQLRKEIKEAFDREQIEIPYSRIIVYNDEP